MKGMWKCLLAVYFIVAFPIICLASPFVVSDAYPTTVTQPDGFMVTVDGGAAVDSPAQAVVGSGVRMYFDVGTSTSGTHAMTIKAYKNDAVWGRLESTTVNFTFTRPASPTSPAGITLVK
jgi:hypothetical protein